MNQEIAITSSPATTVRSSWTESMSGDCLVAIYGDWGTATKLTFVFTPVGEDTDDTVAAPSGASNQEYPAIREVSSADVEKVFVFSPGGELYRLAVIPTGNNGVTDLKIVFVN